MINHAKISGMKYGKRINVKLTPSIQYKTMLFFEANIMQLNISKL